MIEAFMDPKTWLFALFAAINNVPNSISIQLQLIIVSLGYNTLQSTLLASVPAVIGIVAISISVKFSSRVPNSIAWVGIVCFISNLIGIFLVNFLPWHDKVGLLLANSIPGTHDVLRIHRLI